MHICGKIVVEEIAFDTSNGSNTMANKPSIVFFDIGDVLFNEDVPHLWLFHTLFLALRSHEKNVFWDDFNKKRIELATLGPNPESAIKETLAFYCSNSSETETLWAASRAKYDEMRKPRPYGLLLDGITPVLQELKKEIRLGVIANQHPPVEEALYNYGIGSLFDVIVISETVHLYKPDPAIFLCGLEKAGVSPAEGIFVGDRADNDILPAKSLGMRTIRFKRGVQYVHYNPQGAEFEADSIVTDVAELPSAVRAVVSL